MSYQMIEDEKERNDMYLRAAARIESAGSAPERERTPPQREDSGRFAPTERPTGREAEERANGYKPLKEERSEPEGITVRDASAERSKEIQARPIEVHESGLDEKITLSAEQAAKRVAEARKADADQAQLDQTKVVQKAVDDLRASAPETQPRQPQLTVEADLERALNHPAVRDAITERVTAADTQRTAYERRVSGTLIPERW